jgi:nucleotide-binding universal stress UspA family protein
LPRRLPDCILVAERPATVLRATISSGTAVAPMRPFTLDTVLVATDLSDEDVPALQTAMRLAHLTAANLHVVHAAADGDRALDDAVDRHLRRADPTADVLPGSTVRRGAADRVILDVAGAVEADVIVLGPHRREQSRSPGGTAYRVAAAADRPCLVLPGAMALPLGRVLVPVNASGAARGALAVAMTWASALRRRQSPQSPDATELVIMHVEDQAAPDDPSAAELIDAAVSAVTSRIAPVAGVRVRREAAQSDDAAAAIVERARADAVDLIVLGTRGEIGTASELGSVSSSVIRTTRCPVLLVPPRLWGALGEEPLP